MSRVYLPSRKKIRPHRPQLESLEDLVLAGTIIGYSPFMPDSLAFGLVAVDYDDTSVLTSYPDGESTAGGNERQGESLTAVIDQLARSLDFQPAAATPHAGSATSGASAVHVAAATASDGTAPSDSGAVNALVAHLSAAPQSATIGNSSSQGGGPSHVPRDSQPTSPAQKVLVAPVGAADDTDLQVLVLGAGGAGGLGLTGMQEPPSQVDEGDPPPRLGPDSGPTAVDDTLATNIYYVARSSGFFSVSADAGVLFNDLPAAAGDLLFATAVGDPDPDGFVPTTLGGGVKLKEDGSFLYRPASMFSSFDYTDSFRYSVDEPGYGGSDAATVNISVALSPFQMRPPSHRRR